MNRIIRWQSQPMYYAEKAQKLLKLIQPSETILFSNADNKYFDNVRKNDAIWLVVEVYPTFRLKFFSIQNWWPIWMAFFEFKAFIQDIKRHLVILKHVSIIKQINRQKEIVSKVRKLVKHTVFVMKVLFH